MFVNRVAAVIVIYIFSFFWIPFYTVLLVLKGPQLVEMSNFPYIPTYPGVLNIFGPAFYRYPNQNYPVSILVGILYKSLCQFNNYLPVFYRHYTDSACTNKSVQYFTVRCLMLWWDRVDLTFKDPVQWCTALGQWHRQAKRHWVKGLPITEIYHL